MLILPACKNKIASPPENKKAFCLSDTMQKMITIDSVRQTSIDDELQLSGEVSFDENRVNKIFPRSSGHVIQCNVSMGDHVHAGQTLAIIRSADVAGNYADLSGAESDIKIAKRQLDNAESLYKNGISSEREYTEAKANYDKALSNRKKIESLIHINGGTSSNAGGTYVLTSPIDGYVVEKKINAGNFIRQDMNDYLFTISDMKDVWIQANVFEADIPRVKPGLSVKVTTLAYPDHVFNGTIESLGNVLDPSSKALKVRIRLQNPGMLLKPEMFTKVIVSNHGQGTAVAVPSAAVVEEDGKSFVVIYKSNCDLKVQEIEIMKVQGDLTYVTYGLTAGQMVITKNALLLYNQFTDN